MESNAAEFGRGGYAAGYGRFDDAGERLRLYQLLQERIKSGDWEEVRRCTEAFLAGKAAGAEAKANGVPWPGAATPRCDGSSLHDAIGDLIDQSLRAAFAGVSEALTSIRVEL